MSSDTSSARLTGKVKWFNNKSGFGFITVCDGNDDFSGKDIFVHFSSVNVADTQYRYLVQGEYVDFELSKPEKGDHEFHAVKVSGVKGGTLMCETRRQNVEKRPYEPRVYKTAESNEEGFTRVSKKRPVAAKRAPPATKPSA